jgi:hypothetical protein
MNTFSQLRVVLLISLFVTGSVHAANTPIVQDGSIDGGARIMKIHCPSGKRTTVRLYIQEFNQYKPGETCIYKADGSDICKSKWDLDEAAVEACKVK